LHNLWLFAQPRRRIFVSRLVKTEKCRTGKSDGSSSVDIFLPLASWFGAARQHRTGRPLARAAVKSAPLKIITRVAENNYEAVAVFLSNFRMRQ
jgi:hypothetical protein